MGIARLHKDIKAQGDDGNDYVIRELRQAEGDDVSAATSAEPSYTCNGALVERLGAGWFRLSSGVVVTVR